MYSKTCVMPQWKTRCSLIQVKSHAERCIPLSCTEQLICLQQPVFRHIVFNVSCQKTTELAETKGVWGQGQGHRGESLCVHGKSCLKKCMCKI